MPTKTATKHVLLEGMAQRLGDILDRYRAHLRDKEARDSSSSLVVLNPADLEGLPLPPRWVSALREQERDPVRYSLKMSAREIGWRAFAIGGLNHMHAVADRMEELRPATTFHGSILDKWWDGIGCDEHGIWYS